MTTGTCLLLLAALATTVAAADDAEFAFNLLSDVAPILALFGDEFAKQFISESLTLVDHLIFAMVPLGIITAITCAIRVRGRQVAKAFIGRARENRATAEIELMSSTSGEVCELFNGNSIVRAMGKPKIGELMIFPREYDDLAKEYKAFDEAQTKSDSGPQDKEPKEPREPKDQSCGIHSLRTATSSEPEESKLMDFTCFSHSDNVTMAQEHKKLPKPARSPIRDEENTPPSNDTGTATTGARSTPPETEKELVLQGPPNLQLNLSDDHFDHKTLKLWHETIVAAIFAVLLQTGLIVVAAVTAYYLSPRSPSFLESRVYGFPCYAAGSALLSIGTGVCSFIVERSTIEHSWKVKIPTAKTEEKEAATTDGKDVTNPDEKQVAKRDGRATAPRLVWIQQYQTVNDQSFNSYVILAGPKRQVITSRRYDDIRKNPPKNSSISKDSYPGGNKDNPTSHSSYPGSRKGDSASKGPSSDNNRDEKLWGWLAIGAALFSGVGFTAQFMGLRGLPFPCSVAQLGAIFLMALIRAFIRRRLGRVPAHLSALDRYELDFLATHIVFFPDIRRFYRRKNEEKGYWTGMDPADVCRWKVRTLDPAKHDPFFVRSSPSEENTRQQDPKSGTRGMNEQPSKAPPEQQHSEDTAKDPASELPSSQQLLRVRERLGDLCKFTSKSLESALSLAQSIELFMDTFLPLSLSGKQENKAQGSSPPLNWLIEVTNLAPNATSENLDRIKIPVVRRKSDKKWQVDIGKIEATLSLWMASIVAKKSKAAKNEQKDGGSGSDPENTTSPVVPTQSSDDTSSNWRHKRAGDDLRCSFGRIIGDNLEDDVLKRDISWWVDSVIADQNGSDRENDNTSNGTGSKRDIERRWSKARSNDVDLVIGFNGYMEHSATAWELGVTSKDCLPTVLAQHLFTSFMWTVVESLPRNCLDPGVHEIQQQVEIDGPDTFDPYDFTQTWPRLKLRHRQLTKVVRKMESYGLGRFTDILLCMIPALSFKSLLPNHAVLRLMPRVGSGPGWVETAKCYKKLLETIKKERGAEDDKLIVTAVVKSIDFLTFAYEPYDERIEPPWDLDTELEAITEELNSADFRDIREKLAPFYLRQRRPRLFCDIPEHPMVQVTDLDKGFVRNILEITQHHLSMFKFSFEDFQDGSRLNMRTRSLAHLIASNIHRDEKGAEICDIFGWTPYHYSCLVGDGHVTRIIFSSISSEAAKRLPKLLDNLGRSPIHIAAFSGSYRALSRMLLELSREARNSVINAGGIDKMTPLHLASRSGKLDCLEVMAGREKKLPLAEKDFWGRQALHIASMFGHDKVTIKLLELGSRSDGLDDVGKCPVDYFVEGWKRNDESAAQEQHSIDSPGNELETKAKHLSNERLDLFLKFAMEPACQFSNGKSFLHIAVEVVDNDSIRQLLRENFDIEARDKDGRTPLHCAILYGNVSAAITLLDKSQKTSLAKDSRNTTALMFAVQKNLMEVAEALLPSMENESSSSALELSLVNAADDDKKTAIHYARGREMGAFLVRKRCDLKAKDSDGRTALHAAIARGDEDVALFLLELEDPGQLQTDKHLFDNDESLLVTACKRGLSKITPEILTKWPGILNVEDSQFGQTPISWACEKGHGDVVEKLLQYRDIDVNKSARGYMGYAPLHLAIEGKDIKSLDLLLKQSSVDLYQRSEGGKTPLDLAMRNNNIEAARKLLRHERTTRKQHLRYLKEFSSSSSNQFRYFIGDILEKVAGQGALDEDNWFAEDYATRFDYDGNLASLVSDLKSLDGNKEHEPNEPIALILSPFETSVQVTRCTSEGQNACSKVHDFDVIKDSSDVSRVCMRSNHSIPPSREYFYFEVKVLHDSASRILGIGFCGLNDSYGKMPGWFEGSWGYHGDDGELFLESGLGGIPSPDFGDPATYKSGDVVGVCLNVKTGQGFCTHNGKRLNMGDAFKVPDERFKFGKMYPCVGVDVEEEGVGLRFQVNFDGTGNHPFMYEGPFDF